MLELTRRSILSGAAAAALMPVARLLHPPANKRRAFTVTSSAPTRSPLFTTAPAPLPDIFVKNVS